MRSRKGRTDGLGEWQGKRTSEDFVILHDMEGLVDKSDDRQKRAG